MNRPILAAAAPAASAATQQGATVPGQNWQDRFDAIMTHPLGGMIRAYDVDDATVVFAAPLTRDFVHDPDGFVRIRPIVSWTHGMRSFDVQECRVRTLTGPGTVDGNAVVFHHDGQRVEVLPADEDAAWVIDAWDDWVAGLHPADQDGLHALHL